MELKRRVNFWQIIGAAFCFLFVVYIISTLAPVRAVNYEIDTQLIIPSIKLNSDVTRLEIENSELKTPDTIVGSFSRSSNRTLLIGHSTTAFRNLKYIKIDDYIIYNDSNYIVKNIKLMRKVDIDMSELLSATENNTIILMTCAGIETFDRDFTHRLIIEASAI